MSEQNHVVFKGQLADGVNADLAKQKLAAMFKINVAQAEAMLGGKPVYIKKNVDLATAKKYQAAMLKAGAVAEIVSPAAAQPAQNTAPAAKAPAAASGSAAILPGSSANSEIPDTNAPQTMVKMDANTDISSISMAETGAELQTAPVEAAEPALDLNGLSLAEAGADVQTAKADDPALNIDTSSLSME